MKNLHWLSFKRAYIFGIIAIITIFNIWFSFNSLFSHGDWSYFSLATQKEFATIYQFWNTSSGIGSVIQTPFFIPVQIVIGLFAQLGIGFNITMLLVFMIPSIIGSFSGVFLLTKEIKQGPLASLLSGLFFTLNTYWIFSNTGHLTITNGSVGVIWMIYGLIKTRKHTAFRLQLPGILIASIGAIYSSIFEFRMFFIGIILVILLACIELVSLHKKILTVDGIRILRPFVLVGFSSVVFSLFWLIPVILLGQITGNEAIGASLFGNQFLNTSSAITIHHPFWTGVKPSNFILQPVQWYAWLLPIIALGGYVTHMKKKYAIYAGLLVLFGVVLSKQSDEPFGMLYLWLFENVPGFNVFREGSKFFLPSTLGISLLLGYTITYVQNIQQVFTHTSFLRYVQKYALSFTTMCITILLLLNAVPVFSGSIGTLFDPKERPEEYKTLQTFLEGDSEFSRVLWVPKAPRWGYYSHNKPKLSIANLYKGGLRELTRPQDIPKGSLIEEYYTHVLEQDYFTDIMSAYRIKYVIVPLVDELNDDNFFPVFSSTEDTNVRSYFISKLNEIQSLTPISIGTEEIVVYENTIFEQENIRTGDNAIYSIQNGRNTQSRYNFLTSEVGQTDAVIFNQSNEFTTDIIDPFFEISPQNVIRDSQSLFANVLLSDNKKHSLYINATQRFIRYTYNNGIITLYAQPVQNITLDNTQLLSDDVISIIAEFPVSGDSEYVISSGTQFFDIKGEGDLGWFEAGELFTLYEKNTNSVLSNGSFEEGLWKDTVSNCNKYDENGIISMNPSNIVSDGQTSLQLSATRHTACTSTKLALDANQNYIISFDYYSPNAQYGEYKLLFDDLGQEKIESLGDQSEQFISINEEDRISQTTFNSIFARVPVFQPSTWDTYQRIFKTPSNVDISTLTLYTQSADEITNITTLYDNVRVHRLQELRRIVLDESENKFNKVEFDSTGGLEQLVITDSSYSWENLVRNPSFEGQLWQPVVGNCNKFDENPILSMGRNFNSKSQGETSLELSATRHIACTSQVIDISEGSFLFSFDHQSPSERDAIYTFTFNDPEGTIIQDRIPSLDTWDTFSTIVTAPKDATTVTITLAAAAFDNATEIINRYDNVSLIALPPIVDQYYIVSQPKTDILKKPVHTSISRINPGILDATIEIISDAQYALISIPEGYHPDWSISSHSNGIGQLFTPTSSISSMQSVFGTQVWVIPVSEVCELVVCKKDGDNTVLNVRFEFLPQRTYSIGFIISLLLFISSVGAAAVYMSFSKRSSTM